MDEQPKSIPLEGGSINVVDKDWQIQCSSHGVKTVSQNVFEDQTEVPSTSERMPHDKSELSLNDLSAHHVTGTIQYKTPNKAPEKEQSPPICAPLPISTRRWNHCEKRQASTTIRRSQNSLKRTSQTGKLDGDDLCASILLACLFCQPFDCLLASGRGLRACMSSLCSEMCGCEITLLDSLQTVTDYCCGCLDSPCCLCGRLDCSVCEVCLTATECLDLGMEISQMLFH